MQKILTFFFILTIIASSCKSTKPAVDADSKTTAEVNQKIPYEKLESSLLWKISGNGLSSASYLYGTIHIIPKDDYFLPKGTLEAVGNSKTMVFEIDMKEMNNLAKQMGLLTKAFMKDGITLKDLYTDEEYAIVKDHFDKMGIPLFFMERMKPMLLTIFASGDIDPNSLKSGEIKSYEMELFDLSESSNMTTGGLETMEYQMSIFDSIPYDEQADMLLETIEMGEEAEGSLDQMVEIYKAQDIEAMQTMFEEEEGGIDGHEDLLLINRNKNWIPIMGEYMKEGITFFAVGAGHLGGPQGVIHLLKEEGYTLEAVIQ